MEMLFKNSVPEHLKNVVRVAIDDAVLRVDYIFADSSVAKFEQTIALFSPFIDSNPEKRYTYI